MLIVRSCRQTFTDNKLLEVESGAILALLFFCSKISRKTLRGIEVESGLQTNRSPLFCFVLIYSKRSLLQSFNYSKPNALNHVTWSCSLANGSDFLFPCISQVCAVCVMALSALSQTLVLIISYSGRVLIRKVEA